MKIGITDIIQLKSMRELVDASDTLFLATSTTAISEVWDCIADASWKNKIICYFSGSLSCDVFSDYEQKDIQVCSVHSFCVQQSIFHLSTIS